MSQVCHCRCYTFPHRRDRQCVELDQGEPTLAERILGRPIYQETRRSDVAEIKRYFNRRGDK